MATTVFVGSTEYFPGIGKIPYEGRESDNALAFKFYDADKLVGGKRMADHLRFAACYWHTFCAKGSDPFGVDTQVFPWDEPQDPLDAARARLDAAFEFFTKLGGKKTQGNCNRFKPGSIGPCKTKVWRFIHPAAGRYR